MGKQNNYTVTKAFLESYVASKGRILSLQEDLYFWENYGANISQKISDDPAPTTRSTSSKAERAAINHADTIRQLKHEIAVCENQRDAVYDAINQVSRDRYRELLEARYIAGLSVGRIATNFNKSYSSVYRMLEKAEKMVNDAGKRDK